MSQFSSLSKHAVANEARVASMVANACAAAADELGGPYVTRADMVTARRAP